MQKSVRFTLPSERSVAVKATQQHVMIRINLWGLVSVPDPLETGPGPRLVGNRYYACYACGLTRSIRLAIEINGMLCTSLMGHRANSVSWGRTRSIEPTLERK